MSSLFSTPSANTSEPVVPDGSLRVQTSVEGMARPIVWGRTRLAGNLIWYGDFYAVAVTSGGSNSGGKGGDQPAQQAQSYNYYASVEIGLCEGVISSTGQIWVDKALSSLGDIGFTVFNGSASQLPWSYLTAAHGPRIDFRYVFDVLKGFYTAPAGTASHAGEALSYRNTAYVAGNVALGSNSSLPNWTFEITGQVANGAPGHVDAEFTAFLNDFLTNPLYGVPGWTGAFNADWTQARQYTLSANLLISLALTSQTSAQSLLSDMINSVNLMPVWSDAQLKLVTRGDAPIANNGAAYMPPSAPIYDLTDSDFLSNQSSFGTSTADPVSGKRTPPRQQNNVVKVAFLDRANQYNPASISAQDDGAILKYGLRGSSGVNDWKWFRNRRSRSDGRQPRARAGAHRKRVLLHTAPALHSARPGDIVTITDDELGLFRQWVRITDIQENADRSLNVLAEEYLTGSASAPLYGREANIGSVPDYNLDPGATNAPFILSRPMNCRRIGYLDRRFRCGPGHLRRLRPLCVLRWRDLFARARWPRARLGPDGRARSAAAPGNREQHRSYHRHREHAFGRSYAEPGRPFVRLADRRAGFEHRLLRGRRDHRLSGGNPERGQQVLAELFGPQRLWHRSSERTHPAGSQFLRLDGSVLKVPFDQARIGSTIYLKFVPFNVWGGGGKTLADVPAYTYKLTGSALTTPLPVVKNVHTSFEGGFQKIWWDDIADFRTGIRYIVKKGVTFNGAQTLGDVAHPPFVAFGDGTYWVQAYCQPVAALLVYSEFPTSMTIAGSMLTENIISTIDFRANGWTGTFEHVSEEGADPSALLRLTGAANLLADPNVLDDADVLNAGATFLDGTWTSDEVIDIGYVANCSVNAGWLSTGIPIGTDVLAMSDFLNEPDMLASASAIFVNVWVEVRWASAGTLASPTWGSWQKYVPGIYRAQFLQFRVRFTTVDPGIIAYLTAFSVQISIPARIDNYIGNNVTTAGLTITFEPDNAAAPRPFNGGSLVGGAGNHPLPSVSMDWQGTRPRITSSRRSHSPR